MTLTALFVAWTGLPPEAANVLAVAACAILNYLAADRLIFTAADATDLLLPRGQDDATGPRDARAVNVAEAPGAAGLPPTSVRSSSSAIT